MFGEKGCEKLVSHFINCILENPPFQEKNGANYKVKELNVDFENLVFLNPHVNANKIKERFYNGC
ncbi:MAG: hypothetical protein LBV42_00050 [Methanobrevibacter sp.]|nr:hypothetical protein [Methanobrevibacter sp.]